MTKTKKIICLALAILMIGTAVFFSVYNKVGKKYDYSKIKDFSKYITIGNPIGVAFEADDSDTEAPDAEDVRTKVATKLRSYIEKDADNANVKVTDTAAVIGEYDMVYVNYYGTYEDDNSNVIYFTAGSKMDKNNPDVFYVKSGDMSQLFADLLEGKNPNPDAYTLKATGAEGDDSVIDEDDIVYITYTWVRYPYLMEDGVRVQEDGKDKVDENAKQTNSQVDDSLVVSGFRLDLSNVPAYFPDGFKDRIVGQKTGTLDTMTFDDVEIDEGENGIVFYRYEYTVKVDRVIDDFGGYEIGYTYPDDSDAKDLFGNELKGKTVVFHVVIASFCDVPTLNATYPEDKENAESEQISIVMHKDYINFGATDYYKEHVKSETDWLAEAENAGKTHDNYVEYVRGEYELSVLHDLNDEYDEERMEAAAAPLWEAIKGLVTEVNPPKKAVKLAKSDLESQFKYVFSNYTFTNAAGSSVSYRAEYGSYKKFMAACYNDADVMEALGLDMNAAYKKAIEDGKSWGECLDAAVNEIVTNKLIIYSLYNSLGDDVKYSEAEFESKRYMMYIYYSYGYGALLPDSALREALMFDSVLKYVYDNAEITWSSAAEAPAAPEDPGENP